MIQILVLEDNFYERQRIISILEATFNDIRIFEAESGFQAIELFESNDIDLFFLDIQLPDLSGLDVAERIRKISKYEFAFIVFITTHVYLQMDAFKKIHCYDFIEKPYKKEDIIEITQKLIRGTSSKGEKKDQNKREVRFILKSCTLRIYVEEILFVESQKRNCLIHTKYKQYEISNFNMKKMLDILPYDCFMQTHKSYIINLENIREIVKKERNSWTVYFDDYNIPAYISNKNKEEFIKRMHVSKDSD